MNVTTSQIDLISSLLSTVSLRHRVIANNVANVNTPNYKRLDVTFAESFSHALQSGGLPTLGQPKIVEDTQTAERVDGNTVDIDIEMNTLNKNALLYETLAQVMASRIASLRSAITGQ